MNVRRIARLSSLAFLSSLVVTAGCDDGDLPTAGDLSEVAPVAEAPAFPGGEPLKVLTRNMYLGGNVNLVFGADFSNPAAVAAAATAVWGQVQATDFAERAKALADEIDEARPHVVAIQEIPEYLVLDGAFQPIDLQDHLGILQAELQGLPYTLASFQTNTTAIMPVFLPTGLHYVRYTDRIAVLVRNDLEVTDVVKGTYQASQEINPQLTVKRGWIRVSADVGGVPYHFVNTHLEIQAFWPTQLSQTQELIESVTAGLEGVTILMGDLNSNAEAGPGAPSWTPTYETLIAAGFQDAWALDHPGVPHDGLTCCQADELDNEVTSLSQRIDFILIRATEYQGSDNRIPGSIHVKMVGEEQTDRTDPSGLWPSDHAGLLGSLKLPSALFRSY